MEDELQSEMEKKTMMKDIKENNKKAK